MYLSETASQTRTNVGRDLLLSLWNLIGWLWFAIGGSHMSDRLPRPHASEHVIREGKKFHCKRNGKFSADELKKNNVHG